MSTLKCNSHPEVGCQSISLRIGQQLRRHLARRLLVEDFSRAMVAQVGDVNELTLAEAATIGAFGQVLPYQSAGIPGRLRRTVRHAGEQNEPAAVFTQFEELIFRYRDGLQGASSRIRPWGCTSGACPHP